MLSLLLLPKIFKIKLLQIVSLNIAIKLKNLYDYYASKEYVLPQIEIPDLNTN